MMSAHEREQELRERLAAYTARQAERARDPDRIARTRPTNGDGGPGSAEVAEPVASAVAEPAQGSAGVVTVIVPVYNAADELERCVASLARNTTYPARLLLIDDASTDPRTDAVLDRVEHWRNVTVLRNVNNLGFPATVNRGLRASVGDVVLLNSDTEVGPRWLEQLVAAAYAKPNTATATALSDNAGAFSAPVPDTVNPLPVHVQFDDVARAVARHAGPDRPATPTGNGFCLFIKRAVVRAIGGMDAAAFGRGYGEENDFCMRASEAGWDHVVDPATYVRHRRAASFGPEKEVLAAAARRRLGELHPEYTSRVRAFAATGEMSAARERVRAAMSQAATGHVRPRLLFVIHDGGGGAVATNRDLMSALAGEFECFCFSSDRSVLRLTRVEGNDSEIVEEWNLERPLLLADVSRDDYRRAFAAALARSAPELVHVRHMFKHTFDAPAVAASRDVPVVMSFHDHYCLCPTIHLLDERGRYCGGICTPGAGACPTVRAGTLPPLKHAFVHQWREELEAALAHVDAFVTSSEYTRQIHRRFLCVTRGRPFEVIEHGRHIDQRHDLCEAPVPGGVVRILVQGHLDRHKGADLLAAISALDDDGRLELHLVGEVPERYRHLGRVHGQYAREDLTEIIRRVRPAFVGVLSATGESYSHALTEAWAAGVPVLATNLGAQAERVRSHGGGFIVPHDDPAEALAAIFAAADDPDGYAREQLRAIASDLPDIEEMGSRYSDLYRDVLARRRAFTARTPNEDLGPGLIRITALLPAGATPDGRSARMITHPAVRWRVRARCQTGSEPIAEQTEAVLVFGDTIAPDSAQPLVEELRRRSLPLIALCDGGGPVPNWLLEHADVIATADPRSVPAFGRARVATIPAGMLDERLFLDDDAPQSPSGPDEPITLAYVAEPDENAIPFLSAVVDRLERRAPGRFRLEVVSTSSAGFDGGGVTSIDAPDPEQDHPGYAAVLRRESPRWAIVLVPGTANARRYVEYAAVGVVGVYGAMGALGTIREGVTGVVCDEDPESWSEAISCLAAEPQLRERIRANARADVIERRLMRDGAEALIRAIAQGLGTSAAGRSREVIAAHGH